MLKIAIPNKGRLCEETLELLRSIGLRVSGGADRTLIHHLHGGKYEVLFARAHDIPEFVEIGAMDVGVTGIDMVEETQSKVDRLLDLGFGRCRLVVAVPENSPFTSVDRIPKGASVATSFPNLTRDFFARHGNAVSIVPVTGSTEIAPHIGVAELIVDLTETGSTLKKNHLKPLDTVLETHAVLVANRTALATRNSEVMEFAGALQSVLDASKRRYLMTNCPRAALDDVRRVVPGISGPTLMNLMGVEDMVAVHAVVPEDRLNEIIPRLKALGATGILVLPIERMVV